MDYIALKLALAEEAEWDDFEKDEKTEEVLAKYPASAALLVKRHHLRVLYEMVWQGGTYETKKLGYSQCKLLGLTPDGINLEFPNYPLHIYNKFDMENWQKASEICARNNSLKLRVIKIEPRKLSYVVMRTDTRLGLLLWLIRREKYVIKEAYYNKIASIRSKIDNFIYMHYKLRFRRQRVKLFYMDEIFREILGLKPKKVRGFDSDCDIDLYADPDIAESIY